MKFLSGFSLIASMVYLYMGITTYRHNKESRECRTFLLLNISMAIWSFAYSFAYTAEDVYAFSFWNKLSAIGWCTFSALILYMVMVIADSKMLKYPLLKVLIFLPAPVFLFISVFLFGPDIDTNRYIAAFFYTGNFLYNFSYLLISIVVMYFWGRKPNDNHQKEQSNIIVAASLTPFLLNLLTQSILPVFGVEVFPKMGQLYSLIMLWGVHYAITRYQFMDIPSKLITDELFNEIVDVTFLVDLKGKILRTNKQVQLLLQYEEKDLVNAPIIHIINDATFKKSLNKSRSVFVPIRINEITINSKAGIAIPFSLSIRPLIDHRRNRKLGLLVVGQDIRTIKSLQYEIENHKITAERLRNSEKFFRSMVEALPFAIILTSIENDRITYINSKSEELFNVDKIEVVGKSAAEFYRNPQDRSIIVEDIHQGSPVKEREIAFKRKDGSIIYGLLTVVPTLYIEQDAVLACIIDISEQKKLQESIMRSRDEIEKINRELLASNVLLHEKSIRDGLSNLYNHQYINELLEQKIMDAIACGKGLCLMMLDIDYFKRINDTFGHQAGDKVIVTLSDLIRRNIRELDIAGRYGGEEFIIIFPQMSQTDVYKIAERIRKSIQDYDFGFGDVPVTVSIGLAQYGAETAEMLINAADELLYQAKMNGRNRTETLLSALP